MCIMHLYITSRDIKEKDEARNIFYADSFEFL